MFLLLLFGHNNRNVMISQYRNCLVVIPSGIICTYNFVKQHRENIYHKNKNLSFIRHQFIFILLLVGILFHMFFFSFLQLQ